MIKGVRSHTQRCRGKPVPRTGVRPDGLGDYASVVSAPRAARVHMWGSVHDPWEHPVVAEWPQPLTAGTPTVCLHIFPTSRPPPWSARNESSSRLLALFVCPPSAAECFCLCWSLHACTYVSYRCASVCAYWARVWPCSWLDLGAPSCGRLISLRLQGRQPLTQRNILPYRFEQKVTAVKCRFPSSPIPPF